MRKRTLFNKYTLLKTIHQGEFSTVYLARHEVLDSLRIIKSIPKHSDTGCRSHREAYILKNLNHPSIPSCYDIEEDDNNLYIIEQYIDGESLKSFSTHNKLSHEDIITITKNICEVLAYLHNLNPYILHLDLKPENIIIHQNLSITLIDFGNAIYEGDSVDYSIGTTGYASPEQSNQEKLDRRSEIYSLGVLILFMCTGSINHENIRHIKNISLRNITATCLHFNPSNRYSTVYEIIKELNKKYQTLSLKIGIFGIKACVGVTHICLLLGKLLSHLGYKVLVCEEAERISFSNLIHTEDLSIHNGLAHYEGFDILPYYYDTITDIRLKNYDIIIYDQGITLSKKSRDINICVGHISPHVTEETLTLLKQLSPDKDMLFLANLSETGNLNLRKLTGIEKSFSVPFVSYLNMSQTSLKALMPIIKSLFRGSSRKRFHKIKYAFKRI